MSRKKKSHDTVFFFFSCGPSTVNEEKKNFSPKRVAMNRQRKTTTEEKVRIRKNYKWTKSYDIA